MFFKQGPFAGLYMVKDCMVCQVQEYLVDPREQERGKFISKNGLVEDPVRQLELEDMARRWTDEERKHFHEQFMLFPKVDYLFNCQAICQSWISLCFNRHDIPSGKTDGNESFHCRWGCWRSRGIGQIQDQPCADADAQPALLAIACHSSELACPVLSKGQSVSAKPLSWVGPQLRMWHLQCSSYEQHISAHHA